MRVRSHSLHTLNGCILVDPEFGGSEERDSVDQGCEKRYRYAFGLKPQTLVCFLGAAKSFVSYICRSGCCSWACTTAQRVAEWYRWGLWGSSSRSNALAYELLSPGRFGGERDVQSVNWRGFEATERRRAHRRYA